MRFGSVCSGIEAASVAWTPLGWKAAWLSEIEPFPCAVLAHHYPDVPNHGDMTTLPKRILLGEVEAPDLFCGGTPCQAFSVAGLRQSLDDARGNLSLIFCEIADAIDHVRSARGEQPAIIFWENVPGVLSTKDNAFGCFLAGLAGEDDPLVAPGGRWANSGCVYGPQRAVAWRTLDAQYFGLAQRRRRVFVVASARNGFDPSEVLFEWDGVRRDTAPRREAGQETSAEPGSCLDVSRIGALTAGFGKVGAPEIDAYTAIPVRTWPAEVAPTINAASGAKQGLEDQHVFQGAGLFAPGVTHSLRGEGFDASKDGTGRGTPLVPVSYAIQAGALRTNPASGPDGVGVQESIAYTIEARAEVQAVAFAQNSRDEVRLMNGDGQIVEALAAEPGMKQTCYVAQPIGFNARQDPDSWVGRTGPLDTDGSTQAIAFSSKDHGADATNDLAPTLRAMNHAGSHANGGGQMAVAAYIGTGSTGGTATAAVAFQQTADCLTAAYGTKWNGNASADNGSLFATHAMQVRRLTPVECARLQGFPDDYLSQVTWRGKSPPPDGPMYKALGNSWATPVVQWIGKRIDNATKRSK